MGETRRKWWRDQLFPSWAHRSVLRRLVIPQCEPYVTETWFQYVKMDAWGWEQPGWDSHTAEAFQQSAMFCRALYGPLLNNFRVSPSADHALCQLLEVCRQKQVRAALVILPESRTFRSLYPKPTEDLLRNYLAQLCQTYGTPLVDARAWYDD